MSGPAPVDAAPVDAAPVDAAPGGVVAPAEPPGALGSASDAPAPATILLVDDEPANLDLLEGILADRSLYRLVRVGDAREAVARFEASAPDLVLLDLHMPYVDGFSVLRGIRARTAPDDYLPVLVLTADVTSEAKMRALAGGAQDFLTKPFDLVEVLLRVRNLVATRRLHRAERVARERAEAATAARDRMLSVVAHDLRNPLASVSLNVESVLRRLAPDAEPYQRRLLAAALRTSQGMERLVDDLLDVSRLELGAFTLVCVEEPLDELLGQADALLRPIAEARGVRLTMPDGVPPLLVSVDAARFMQVLSNVVGNAIKFTPADGAVTIAVERTAPDAVRVLVADDGPGIAPDELPHVFDAFRQGAARARGGVGLGLWIARALVEAQGGRIGIASTPGAGTTVHVELGCREPAEAGAATGA